MSAQDRIKKSLIDYDSAAPVIKYLLKNTTHVIKQTTSDYERSVSKFYDKITNELVIESENEIIAIYYSKHQIWCWAWAHVGFINSENFLAKEILLYSLDMDPNLSYIKSLLTTSRGIIDDRTQIDINLAISSSLIKHPYIFPYYHKIGDYTLAYYFVLLNDTDLDALRDKIKESEKTYTT